MADTVVKYHDWGQQLLAHRIYLDTLPYQRTLRDLFVVMGCNIITPPEKRQSEINLASEYHSIIKYCYLSSIYANKRMDWI